MAVANTGGVRQAPAAWLVNRNEFVQHVKNSTYIAIGAIARKCAMQKPEVKIRKATEAGYEEQEAPVTHPLNVLFDEINPFHSLYDYIYYSVGWRLATGDSFVWKARNGLGVPSELWPLPSQWCHVVPSRQKFVDHYKVEGVWGEPVYLEPGEVIHISDPNLDWSGTGRFYGRPTMGAAGAMIDIEEAMLARMLNWFKNYAPPGMVFSGAEGIGAEQIFQLYQILAQQHSLNEHSGRPFVVPEGFTLETGAMTSPKDIDYGKELMNAMDYILAVFGVPKAVCGLVKDTNRANMQASLMSFCENTINPLLEHMSQHHTQNLARDFDENLIIQFPLVTVDDSEQVRKDFETGLKYGCATPNEVREIMLELPAYLSGGDRPLVHSSMRSPPMGNVDPKELEAEAAAEAAAEEKQRRQQLEAQRQQAEQSPGRQGEAGEEEEEKPKPKAKSHEGNGALDPSRQAIMDSVYELLKRRQELSVK
jgi:phage portal protein BeeE